ncbi:hypothetical protein DSCO28_07950 [Desulfosarcina ovata subsp. sediminis]|uniref:Uncharacterized protein n=1 Tax=Desulfosarcina ovata subsp. sediminis TaxID=885957 RepID=A0A5K7ZKR1_9BACT|nr:hypothetical protein [Desulfosarcina ovata]BBO80229.1 hypothetical protein DSCO28_07950 [Desulfosarcina ovata subsp. sediminis]
MIQIDQKRKRVQLQCKSDHDSRLTFSMDTASRQDLEFCKAFIHQMLNVEASASVLLRRSLSALRHHLEGIAIDSSLEVNKDPERGLEAFMDKLDQERDELFHAAGRKEDQHKWMKR